MACQQQAPEHGFLMESGRLPPHPLLCVLCVLISKAQRMEAEQVLCGSRLNQLSVLERDSLSA